MVTTSSSSLSSIRVQAQGKNTSIFDVIKAIKAKNTSISTTRKALTGTKNTSISRAFYPDGWNVFARNVATGVEADLGFVAVTDSPKTVVDAALADGTYEIFLKYQSLYWDDCRDGKRLTVVISGGVTDYSGIPLIQNFRREIEDFKTKLLWNINTDYAREAGLSFGLWFGVGTPVSTAGTPDVIVNFFDGQSNYFYIYTQAVSQYVAVAAMTTTQTGPSVEISIPWVGVAPDSPENQYAERES